MQKTINSTMFRKMIIASAKILDDNKSFVDSLNVFPVPDGDTGTNMSLTYNNVVKELNNCLEKLNILPNTRIEQLTIKNIVDISNYLSKS